MKGTPVDEHPEPVHSPTLWQENHGNLLLAGLAMIMLAGASILWYRQNRFVPAPFPESRLIQNTGIVETREPGVDSEPTLVIMVSGSVNDFGKMMVAVYASQANFNQPQLADLQQELDIQEGRAVWSIPLSKLPEKLAVAAYHDENGDQELNSNSFGIPIERYGFSRNARGLTGPPSFEQAVIDRPKDGTQIEVFVR